MCCGPTAVRAHPVKGPHCRRVGDTGRRSSASSAAANTIRSRARSAGVAPKLATRNRNSPAPFVLALHISACSSAVSIKKLQSVATNPSDSGDSPHTRHHRRVSSGNGCPSGLVSGNAGCSTGSAAITRSGTGSALRRARRHESFGRGPRPAISSADVFQSARPIFSPTTAYSTNRRAALETDRCECHGDRAKGLRVNTLCGQRTLAKIELRRTVNFSPRREDASGCWPAITSPSSSAQRSR